MGVKNRVRSTGRNKLKPLIPDWRRRVAEAGGVKCPEDVLRILFGSVEEGRKRLELEDDFAFNKAGFGPVSRTAHARAEEFDSLINRWNQEVTSHS